MNYLLIFSGSLLLVIFLTPYLINLLKNLNIMDSPGGRKKHTEPVPRMGGLILYIPLLAALFFYCQEQNNIEYIIYSSAIIALCGIADDLWGLKWSTKLILQSISTAVIVTFLYPGLKEIYMFGVILPVPFDIFILYFFTTGVINSVNMLDGLDGLVSGAALLLFMLVFMLSYIFNDPLLMIISASLTGSLTAFLKFNAFPAKIFLGDTGSLIIGFFLALTAILLSNRLLPSKLDLGFAVMLLGLPVIDTLKVILLRLYMRKSPFLADRTHIHHKIQDNNIHHKHTVFIIQLFTLGYIFLSVYYVFYNSLIALVLFINLSAALILFNPLYRRFLRVKNILAEVIPFIYYKKFTVELFRKIIIPGSGLIIIIIVLFIFPSDSTVPAEVIGMMVAVCLMLLAAALLSFKRYHGFNDMYVLLNLTIFFILSENGEPYLKFFNIIKLNTYILLDIAAAVILFFIGVFILFREKIFGRKVSLFSGLDLIMMLFVVFLMLLQYILPRPAYSFIGPNIYTGFIIYIWYKMVTLMLPAITRRIYIMVFILPIAVLLSIMW